MTTTNIQSMNFTEYVNTQFRFAFEHPRDWNFQIQKIPDDLPKNSFVVFIIGPLESSTGSGQSLLSLWVMPNQTKANPPDAVNNYIEDIINKLNKQTSNLIQKRFEQMADTQGVEIEYSINTFRPLRLPRKYQKSVVIHHLRMIVEKSGYIFDLKFSASEADYPSQKNVYENAKKTFKFI
jgi:hypothetical protein